jgi:riboflavin kinase/FMN adenylyltransferase
MQSLNSQVDQKSVYATIGSFDGVHIGHQKLIHTLVERSKTDGAKSMVVTFNPHPAVFLQSIPMPFYITNPQERVELFHSLGVDEVLELNFTREMSNLEPEAFIDLLLSSHPIKMLWLGEDFALGKNRSGNMDRLKEICAIKGIKIEKFHLLQTGNHKISSTTIRGWIKDGNFQDVNRFLNRYYRVEGFVVPGDLRGRKLGFPTANVDVWEGKILPSSGVYASWISIDSIIHPSVTNVGVRPTFYEKPSKLSVEAHILDFNEDIYHKWIQLYFVEKIRPEKKFTTVEALINQIMKDKTKAVEILKNVTQPQGLFT